MKLQTILVVWTSVLYTVSSQCAHDDANLLNWSSAASWSTNQVPDDGDIIDITNPILLDQSPGKDIGMITVKAGGKLVFKQGATLELRTGYILLDGGELHIGGEGACQFTGKASIVLIGEPDTQYTATGFDRKFIGVADGGSLEIHGKNKDSWTKLTATVPKLEIEEFKYRSMIDQDHQVAALVGYRFNPTNGEAISNCFMFSKMASSSQNTVNEGMAEFVKFIDDTADGQVVALAIRKFMFNKDAEKNGLNYEVFFSKVEEALYGSIKQTIARKTTFYDAWSAVFMKGNIGRGMEMFEPYKEMGRHQFSKSSVIESGLKIEATSYTNSGNHGLSYALFEVSDATQSAPILSLASPVNWEAGDKILIASTDYDWRQQEEALVINCEAQCGPNQIRVNWTPRNTHYGEIYKNVDMRAEVALLTRNIHIRGETPGNNDNGGHIKAVAGFKSFRIENAQLTEMGQSDAIGKYPIHWHMAGDVDDKPTYARRNTIQNSYARCITVHGTRGVTLSENVCVVSKGHGYFMEDGDEPRTTFYRNFGSGQKRASLIPTDRDPATFWITTGNVTLVDNAAAGSDAYSYWVMMPRLPIGQAANNPTLQKNQAIQTPLSRFDNNIAHSNGMAGVRMMEGLSASGGGDWGIVYTPLSDPLNKDSDPAPTTMNKITAYKNRRNCVEIRGGWVKVEKSSLSDCKDGVYLENRIDKRTEAIVTIRDSVVIGDSANRGEPSTVTINEAKKTLDRSLPDPRQATSLRRGIRFFSRRQIAENLYFDGFSGMTDVYSSTAMVIENAGRWSTMLTHAEKFNFGFDDGATGTRLLFTGNREKFDTESEIITDDGSLTGVSGGGSVVRNDPFFITDKCTAKNDWDMAICDETFARLWFNYGGRKDTHQMSVARMSNGLERRANLTDFGSVNVVINTKEVYVISADDAFKSTTADTIEIFSKGIDKNNNLVVVTCVPKGAAIYTSFANYGRGMPGTRGVCSLDAILNDDEGNLYYYDEAIGAVFTKLLSHNVYSDVEFQDCPNNACPFLRVKFVGGDRSQTDCINNVRQKYASTLTAKRELVTNYHIARRFFESKRDLSLTLPSAQASPPAGVGAGDTQSN